MNSHDAFDRPQPVTAGVRVGVTLGALALFVVVVVSAEVYLPVETKPSILLRVSSGSLPTARLQSVYDEAEANVDAALAENHRIKSALPALRQANQQANQALRALDQRIQEKQATEWAAPQPPALSQ